MGGKQAAMSVPNYYDAYEKARNQRYWPTKEHLEVITVAYANLFRDIPCTDWEQIDRNLCMEELNKGRYNTARAFAVSGGVPDERITAFETLLF